MLTKRRFWKTEQQVGRVLCEGVSIRFELHTNRRQLGVKFGRICIFMLPKRKFWTVERNVRWVFSNHFSRVWVLDFGRLVIEKLFEKTHRTFRAAFQNLRLGSIHFGELVNIKNHIFMLPQTSRRQLGVKFGRFFISVNSSNVWTTKCGSKYWRILQHNRR